MPPTASKPCQNKGDLFFEMFRRGSHAPRPLWIGVTYRSRLHRSDEVAVQQVLIFRFRVFRMEKLFDGFVVALGDVFVDLVPRRSKACPSQKVGHKCSVGISDNCGSH